jgi:hypothetical protein
MASDFTRDGIGYSIAVSTSKGSYFATWTCTKCKVTGGPTRDYQSSEHAIACAQARSFSDHHFDRHVVVGKAALQRMMESR